MKYIANAILVLITAQIACGQTTRSPLTAPYTSIGAYSKNFTDAFSGSINQAALAQTKIAGAGIYAERRFMLKALSNYAAAVSLPSKLGGFGIAIRYFGGADFNTSQIGLGYGKKLGDKIDIGVQFNYNMIKLAGYGSAGVVNFELGSIVHLTDKLHLGMHVYNPADGKFGLQKAEKLAAVYTTGIGYEVSDKVFISTTICKEEDQPVGVNAGMQYVFARQFFARMCIATGTGNYFFGVGVQWKACRVDMATGWHAQLGFTPAIMLLFNLQEPGKKQAAE